MTTSVFVSFQKIMATGIQTTTGVWVDKHCFLIGGSGLVVQMRLGEKFGKDWNWCATCGLANVGCSGKIKEIDNVTMCDGDVVVLTNKSLPMLVVADQRKVGIERIGVIHTTGRLQVNGVMVLDRVETTVPELMSKTEPS